MSTPKIKLYRLFPGYSSSTDNDIQSATNDELLPVTPKNIMPTDAYKLVGVAKKQNQVLIPIKSLDSLYTRSEGFIACTQVIANNFIIPVYAETTEAQQDYEKLIVTKSYMMPIFAQYVQENNGTWKYIQYIPNVDYVYVKEYSEELFASNTSLKFQLYYQDNKWKITFKAPSQNESSVTNLYVSNLFCLMLNIHYVDLTISSQTKYLLSKQENNQILNNKHDFIPAINDFLSYHLRPRILFDIEYSDIIQEESYQEYINSISQSSQSSSSLLGQQLVLTQVNNNFIIDERYILSQVNSNYKITLNVDANTTFQGTIPSNYINGKTVRLLYYSIPKLSQINNCNLFMSQQQYLYHGTDDGKYSKKVNTLFLQNVQAASIDNFSINLNNNTEYVVEIEDGIDFCRGILKDKNNGQTDTAAKINNKYSTFANYLDYKKFDNVIGVFRNVYTQSGDIAYYQKYFVNKNLGDKFPEPQYWLDPYRGIFYFHNPTAVSRIYLNTQISESSQSSSSYDYTYDYLFATYYYRTSPAQIFVSDYQGWVTQHLRNNPDIFYGLKDYQGDDYIDVNDNAIKVGLIPRYLEKSNGYNIYYRNGSITLGPTQDASFTQTEETDDGVSTNQKGVVIGGIARANFAYYNGLQNVQDQQLTYDKDYAGGGYRYKALDDKKFPESLGRRWVKRDNVSQFIGASFITQKLNDSNVLTTYNLPDLQTSQLQTMGKFGFVKGVKDAQFTSEKIIMDYYITTNNYSYPFAFKVSNLVNSNSSSVKYITGMTEQQLKTRHTNLRGINVSQTTPHRLIIDADKQFEFDPSKFEQNRIYFYTMENQKIQGIKVKYSEIDILPALDITFPVLSGSIDTNIYQNIIINKGEDYTYDNFQLNYLDEDNQLQSIPSYNYTVANRGNYVEISINNTAYNTLYLSYTMNKKLYRSYFTNEDKMTTQNKSQQVEGSQSSDTSDSSYNNYVIPVNYKYQSNDTSEIIFSISNVYQTSYFKLKVIDFYSVQNDYQSTIVYSIKKYDM